MRPRPSQEPCVQKSEPLPLRPIAGAMRSTPHVVAHFLRADFARGALPVFRGARASPDNGSSRLLAAYAAVGGNFLGPLVGHDGRNAFLLRDLWRCLELVRGHERSQSVWYRHLGFSRLDLHWVAMPPPLELLRRADPGAVWIPDGQDWDGLNDRFAIVPRRWASAYFGRWPRLLNGSLLPAVRRAAGGARLALRFEAGPEWLLLAGLRAAGAPVRRFSPVAAVLCQPGSRRGRYGRCTRPWPPAGRSFKYSAEASEAHANAARLRLEGWGWRAAEEAPVLSPACFEAPADARPAALPRRAWAATRTAGRTSTARSVAAAAALASARGRCPPSVRPPSCCGKTPRRPGRPAGAWWRACRCASVGRRWGGSRLRRRAARQALRSRRCRFVHAGRLRAWYQIVNYLPRFRFQAKPSHTTRLLVKRPDQYRP
ncbi:unnamed protein product [Prorocentrum cordatum]|uniref:Uncharacterized protein n=1 Tax=Prorocentrum cordatum TaxID=2364126 RepID=A0ABN9Q9V0_9DINO|nr:unnamed protein product [Polarella glacialis]